MKKFNKETHEYLLTVLFQVKTFKPLFSTFYTSLFNEYEERLNDYIDEVEKGHSLTYNQDEDVRNMLKRISYLHDLEIKGVMKNDNH